MLKQAKDSGCIWLLLGIENISKSQMAILRKSPKDIEKIEDCIKKIRDSGIVLYPSFVLGFDTDEKSIFEETYEFVIKNKLTINSFNILTPYPGTGIFEQFRNEGRLLTTNWKYYDLTTVVFKPKNMTPVELQEGVEEITKEVAKTSIIVQRCIEHIAHPIWLLANLAWFMSAKRWVNEGAGRVERIKTGKYDW